MKHAAEAYRYTSILFFVAYLVAILETYFISVVLL